MNELVVIKGNELFTDSLVISNETEYDHPVIQRKIRDYKNEFDQLGKLGFQDRPLPSGQKQRVYMLNEPQASYLLTLLDNRDKVRFFKLALVKEFYRMRRFILERQSAEWQQSRLIGKQTRHDETDIILTKLIPHAEKHGSKNAGRLYLTYSKLVNAVLGIEAGQRDNLPTSYVDAIRFLENAIGNIISIEVDKGTEYHEIYQICKAKCFIIKDLAFLPSIRLIGA
jgi:phage regulator Rha-like protein